MSALQSKLPALAAYADLAITTTNDEAVAGYAQGVRDVARALAGLDADEDHLGAGTLASFLEDTDLLTETYRSRIVSDGDPCAPYDDGSSPLIRFRRDRSAFGVAHFSAEQVTEITSYVLPVGILTAVERWGDDNLPALTRYLRLAYGVTKIETADGQNGDTYLTCDPADWREELGAPEGSITLTEWLAYVQGDVYGVVTEQRVGEDSWEHADSIWGLYGYAHAEYVLDEANAEYDTGARS